MALHFKGGTINRSLSTVCYDAADVLLQGFLGRLMGGIDRPRPFLLTTQQQQQQQQHRWRHADVPISNALLQCKSTAVHSRMLHNAAASEVYVACGYHLVSYSLLLRRFSSSPE
jgi:hypothetical protein